jgi:hypothetical protein
LIDTNDATQVTAMQRALLIGDLRFEHRLRVPKTMTEEGRIRSKKYAERYIQLAAAAMIAFNIDAHAASVIEAKEIAAIKLAGVSRMNHAALKAAATAADEDPTNQGVPALKTLLKRVYASQAFVDKIANGLYKPMRAWSGFEQAFDCALGADIHTMFGLSYIVPGDA